MDAKNARGPATVMCTYRVQARKEEAFKALLSRHWQTLEFPHVQPINIPMGS